MRSLRWKRNQRLKCSCGGYWFPHRRAGGACEHSKTCDLHRAIRSGDKVALAEAEAALAVAGYGRPVNSTRCPF